MSKILNMNKPPPYIGKSSRNNSPSPSPKVKVPQTVVSPSPQNGRQRFMTQDAVNLQKIAPNKQVKSPQDDTAPMQPIIDKKNGKSKQLFVDNSMDAKRRKSSIDIGNEENALQTKEQQREAIMRELEFLQKEVPFYNNVLQDSQASFQGKIDSVDVIELIIIQSLSRWILEYGKPAVVQYDSFKQDAETEVQHMMSSMEELKKRNQQLNVMLQSSEQEKIELKEQHETSNMEVMKLKLQLQKHDHNANDMSLRHQDIQDLETALDASEEKRDQLNKRNQTLQEDLNIIRGQNDELINKNYGLEEEINRLQKELKHSKHIINAQEKRQEEEIKLLTEKYSHIQEIMENENEKLLEEANNNANDNVVTDTSKQTLVLSADGDMEFLDGDAKYRDGLDNGPVFTLEGEIQDYEDPDDAWLSEDEEEVILSPKLPPPQPPIVSPKLEFVLEKRSFGVESAPRMKEFTMEKRSFIQDKMDMSNNFAMQSQKLEIQKEKQEWGHESLQISENAQVHEEWGSETMKISEEIVKKEENKDKEWGNEKIKISEDAIKKEEWGNEKIKISEEAIKKEEWGNEKIKISEEPKKKEEWSSQSIKISEDPKKKEWESQSIKISEDPKKKEQWESQSIKISEDPKKKEQWQSQSIKMSEDIKQPEKSFGSQKIKIIQESKKQEFGSEKIILDQPDIPRKQPLQLELSFTQTAQSPLHAPMAFESEKISDELVYEKAPFSKQKIRMSKEQEEEARRINIIRLPPPPHIPKEQIIKDYGQDEIITKANPFSSLMEQWGKIEKEKGGKPQAANMKEYELINRWKVDAEKAAEAKNKKAVKSEVITGDTSQNRVVGVVKVTKSKKHTIKPRLEGNLTIIKSSNIPDYRLIKQSTFYFCLDGLPLGTNTNIHEPDFGKNRSKDPLVPCLFWFDSQQDYNKLVNEAGDVAVRELAFQKAFAKYAKGIIAFDDKIIADVTEEDCIFELSRSLSKQVVLPANLKDKIPKNNALAFYAISEQQFHRFHAIDTETRDKWIDMIRKLVLKRKGDSTQMHRQSVMRSLSTFSSASTTPAMTPYSGQNSQEVNHRMSVMAHHKMSLISEVENEMD